MDPQRPHPTSPLSPSFTTPLCTSPAPRTGNIWFRMACIQGKLGHLALSPEHGRDRFWEGLGKLCREQAPVRIQEVDLSHSSFNLAVQSTGTWALCSTPIFSSVRWVELKRCRFSGGEGCEEPVGLDYRESAAPFSGQECMK